LGLKILSPEKLKAKARAKVKNWKKEKALAEKRGIPKAADVSLVVRNLSARKALSDKEKERLDFELGDVASATEGLEGREEKIRRLLEAGADVNVRRGNGWTPLMVEARHGIFAEVMKLLIAYGADLDLQNSEGSTALHIAAIDNNGEAAEILIDAGADPHIKDVNGRDVMGVCVWASNSVAYILSEKLGIPLPLGFEDPDVDEEPSDGGIWPKDLDDDGDSLT